jgi:hypothetical protein
MTPPAEHVHWLFATGVIVIVLTLLTEVLVGPEVWNRRPWRAYLWPGLIFALGLLMWPVTVFYTNSAIHMIAHGSWAQVMMLAGATHLGLASGKLKSPYWRLTIPLAFLVSGAAFLIHEQNGWFYARSAFVHHLCGWTLVGGAIAGSLTALRSRPTLLYGTYALTMLVVAVVLFTARDVAPILGHLSSQAGAPHR